jgi:hypothetical protein
MEKRILDYRKYMDELLLRDDVDWEKAKAEHLVQVAFFQHERLIHLIVTVIFAILTMLSICMSFLLMASGAEGGISWLLVVAVFLVLLIPYVRHYYILENEVQKMYRQYDGIVAKLGAGFRCE